MKKVLLISGSLRAQSYNTKLLKAFAVEMEGKAEVEFADLKLPLFSEDLEADFPNEAQTLKDQISVADLIIIATPEYNRAMSGTLKNAIDWGSRPYGKNAWTGKNVFVASVSIGGISGALALYQVKQSMLHMGAIVNPKEFMVGNAGDKFAEDGTLTDEKTKEYVKGTVNTLLA